jgi:hypothetical protein
LENRRTEQVLSEGVGDWYQWDGEGSEERVWEGEYSANTVHMYVNGKMRLVETIPGMGVGR